MNFQSGKSTYALNIFSFITYSINLIYFVKLRKVYFIFMTSSVFVYFPKSMSSYLQKNDFKRVERMIKLKHVRASGGALGRNIKIYYGQLLNICTFPLD